MCGYREEEGRRSKQADCGRLDGPPYLAQKKWTWQGNMLDSLFWPAVMYHLPFHSLVSNDCTSFSFAGTG
jgi:hypothetical protein